MLVKPIRLRAIDGGLDLSVQPHHIDNAKSPRMKDVFFFKGEMRKAPGGIQIGTDFPENVQWVGVWAKENGSLLPIAVTKLDLYYYVAGNTKRWVKEAGGSGFTFTSGAIERFSLQFFDDALYIVSDNNVIRTWNGTPGSTHTAVADGYTARAMTVINNRLMLVAVRPSAGGVLAAQDVRWTANGIVDFTAAGSGGTTLSDRNDTVRNIAKLGPFRGIIYKDESLVEVRATGNAEEPFEFTELLPGLGILCGYSLVEWPGGHFFVGSDEQIYNYTGGNLDAVGEEIKDEFFALLDPARYDHVIGSYDLVANEYILGIPDDIALATGCSGYWAYNIRKRRWRQGVYKNHIYISQSPTKIATGETIDASRKQILISAGKKIFRLDDSMFSFDGESIDFQWESKDFISEDEEKELTLKEVIVQYAVDGIAELTLETSTDEGETFSNPETKILGKAADGTVLPQNRTHYVNFSPLLTAMLFRIRLRNSIPGQRLRLDSIILRVSYAQLQRPEAHQ